MSPSPAAPTLVGGPLYGTPLVFAGRPPRPFDAAQRAGARRARRRRACRRPAPTPRRNGVRLAVEPLNRFETDFCNTGRQALRSGRAGRQPGRRHHARHVPHEHGGERSARGDPPGRAASDPFPGEREPSRLPRHRPYRLAADLPRAVRDRLCRRDHARAVPPHRPRACPCRSRNGSRRPTTRTTTCGTAARCLRAALHAAARS